MINSWAMLYDEIEEMRNRGYEMSAEGIWMGREELIGEDNGDWMGADARAALEQWKSSDKVVLTNDVKTQSQLDIISKCDAVKSLLLEKNAAYGDSALEPVRIFSQATPVEQILVRLDDKLSRISRGGGIVGDDEDVIQDIIGYLILLQIALDRTWSVL